MIETEKQISQGRKKIRKEAENEGMNGRERDKLVLNIEWNIKRKWQNEERNEEEKSGINKKWKKGMLKKESRKLKRETLIQLGMITPQDNILIKSGEIEALKQHNAAICITCYVSFRGTT